MLLLTGTGMKIPFLSDMLEASLDFIFRTVNSLLALILGFLTGCIVDDEIFSAKTDAFDTLLSGAFSFNVGFITDLHFAFQLMAVVFATATFVWGFVQRMTSSLYDYDTDHNTVFNSIIRFSISLVAIVGAYKIMDLLNTAITSLEPFLIDKETFGGNSAANFIDSNFLNLFEAMADPFTKDAGEGNLITRIFAEPGDLTHEILRMLITPFFSILCLFVIIILYVKLIFEAFKRKMTILVIDTLSPFAFYSLVDAKTSEIIGKTIKAWGISVAILYTTKWWLLAAIKMLSKTENITHFFYVIAWLFIGTQLENVFNELGFSSSMMGRGIFDSVTSSLRDLSIMGGMAKNATKSAGRIVEGVGNNAGLTPVMALGQKMQGKSANTPGDILKNSVGGQSFKRDDVKADQKQTMANALDNAQFKEVGDFVKNLSPAIQGSTLNEAFGMSKMAQDICGAFGVESLNNLDVGNLFTNGNSIKGTMNYNDQTRGFSVAPNEGTIIGENGMGISFTGKPTAGTYEFGAGELTGVNAWLGDPLSRIPTDARNKVMDGLTNGGVMELKDGVITIKDIGGDVLAVVDDKGNSNVNASEYASAPQQPVGFASNVENMASQTKQTASTVENVAGVVEKVDMATGQVEISATAKAVKDGANAVKEGAGAVKDEANAVNDSNIVSSSSSGFGE